MGPALPKSGQKSLYNRFTSVLQKFYNLSVFGNFPMKLFFPAFSRASGPKFSGSPNKSFTNRLKHVLQWFCDFSIFLECPRNIIFLISLSWSWILSSLNLNTRRFSVIAYSFFNRFKAPLSQPPSATPAIPSIPSRFHLLKANKDFNIEAMTVRDEEY